MAKLKQIKNQVDAAGRPGEIHTKEDYKIYNCLKNMPNCIKSMEITRGDKNSEIRDPARLGGRHLQGCVEEIVTAAE